MQNLADLYPPPDTREHNIRMARFYLHQAHESVHRNWSFVLLDWAAKRRLRALHFYWVTPRKAVQPARQLTLF
ncbi:MAG: hypothetical protein PHD68_11645 [Rugosibacter sp.]|nr:hypothetical protein [Rugosibacter sp.]